MDQTVLQTQNIENSFEAMNKDPAIFVDLVAAFETVWQLLTKVSGTVVSPASCLGLYRVST